MRTPQQVDAWGHPEVDGSPWPEATTDDDRNVVGTILGPSGRPLHTVMRPGVVEFGYRPPRQGSSRG